MNHRNAGSFPFRPLLLLAGTLGLLLGLLGMHTLGLHHTGAERPGVPAAAAHGHGAEPAADPASPATGRHLAAPPAPLAADPDGGGWCPDACGLEMAVAGLCVVALATGPVFVHLASRALRPVPGRGLAAPPALWVPFPRIPAPPSLAQLSISRT